MSPNKTLKMPCAATFEMKGEKNKTEFMLKVSSYGKTDVGLKRKNNEDAFLVEPELGLCTVADGMGGAAAGELASRIFVDTTAEVFRALVTRSEKEAVELVKKSFVMANRRILEHVEAHPHHAGMGCTAELLAVHGNGFVIGHIGDSRTYRYREGTFTQLTHDHSLVQDQIDKGLITNEEARKHPHRNIINRAVGIGPDISLDVLRGRLQSGDIFLLCSDGLSDMVEDHLIKDIISENETLSSRVRRLIELSKSSGGNDNVTIVMLEFK